jgi:anti-sigma B factor antagonist
MFDQTLLVESLAANAGDQRILRCSGPLVISTLFTFRDAIRAESARHIIVDLTEVPYVDSAGLGALIQAYISLKRDARTLALAGLNERANALLEMTNVSQLFRIYRTLAEAKAASA